MGNQHPGRGVYEGVSFGLTLFKTTLALRLRLACSLASPLALVLTLAACGGNSASSGGSLKREVLYVATIGNGRGEIMSFDIDPSTGGLVATPSTKITTSWPNFMVGMRADPTRGFLYASNLNTGNVHAYSIEPSTGALGDVNGSPFAPPGMPGNGSPIGITPNGKFLFYRNQWDGIGTFSITAGALTPTSVVASDGNFPSDFAVDGSNSFLFVANYTGGQFSAFSLDNARGMLTPVAGSPFTFQTNTLPYAMAIHPNGRFVYSTLSNGVTTPTGVVLPAIEGLNFDNTTGVLKPIAGSPFIYGTGLLEAGPMVLDPLGRFLYASTMGGLMAFTVDSTTGALAVVNGSPFGVSSWPESGGDIADLMAIDPSGNFLYESISTSLPILNGVMGFRIDQLTGGLTAVLGSPFPAGDSPGPLTAVGLP